MVIQFVAYQMTLAMFVTKAGNKIPSTCVTFMDEADHHSLKFG